MRNILIWVSYDGTSYGGWQAQPNAPTISSELTRAIKEVTGEDAHLFGSGRTDAGVHAIRQAANFHTQSSIPPDRIPFALNTRLPRAIRVMAAEEASESFHARYSCVGKVYSYAIDLSKIQSPLAYNRAWHFPYELDMEKVIEAARVIEGRHDFRAFMSIGSYPKSTVRDVSAIDVAYEGSTVEIKASANGFLYNMVRIIVGTLAFIGIGKIKLVDIEKAFEDLDRGHCGITAPACGLYLSDVIYDFNLAAVRTKQQN